jgi:hypothetical protein
LITNRFPCRCEVVVSNTTLPRASHTSRVATCPPRSLTAAVGAINSFEDAVVTAAAKAAELSVG